MSTKQEYISGHRCEMINIAASVKYLWNAVKTS